MNALLNSVLFLRDQSRHLNLSSAERSVLVSLTGRVGNNKVTWIKQEGLADECCLSERHLRNILNKLVEKELIIINSITTKRGKQNTYQVSDKVRNYNPKTRATAEEVIHRCGTIVPVVPHTTGTTVPEGCGTVVPVPPDLSTGKTLEAVGRQEKPPFLKETILNIKTSNIPQYRMDMTVALPSFVNREDWNDFLKFRERQKSPVHRDDQPRMIATLKKMHEAGQNISEVINQSIVNGWKCLLPVKNQDSSLTPRQASLKRGFDMLKNWNTSGDSPTSFLLGL